MFLNGTQREEEEEEGNGLESHPNMFLIDSLSLVFSVAWR